VTLLSTKAGNVAITLGAQEAVWTKASLGELQVDTIPEIITDKGARKLFENPIIHQQTKHININTITFGNK
jgi:hypothetical protein